MIFDAVRSGSPAKHIVDARIQTNAMRKTRGTMTVIAIIDRMDPDPRQRHEASLASILQGRAAFSITIRDTDGNCTSLHPSQHR
jgi:hypothetical protein